MMKILSINVPLLEALEKILGYAKFIKDLVTKKRSMNFETIKVTHQVSAIVHSMAPKLEDPDTFTIPCTIGSVKFAKALCDLGASINLMPNSVFKTLGIGQPRPTSMRLQMVDRTMKRPLGVTEDVLVRVDKFILPVDFVILDCEVDYESMRQPNSNEVCSLVNLVTDVIVEETSVMINVGDILEAVLLNFDDDEMDDNFSYKAFNQRAFYIGVEVIASISLVDSTFTVLQKRKKSIGWTLADIRRISPSFCMHMINLEEGAKPSIEHQRKLNEACKRLSKRRSSSGWMLGLSIQFPIVYGLICFNVSQEGGMTVVTNDKNELIPTRTVTRWRVCMDYCKLNNVTRKDHFPRPFLDQMLDRLAGRAFYCFFDGISATTKFLFLRRIKRKQPLHVHMLLSLSSGCHLVCAMHRHLFKGVRWLSSRTWWNITLKVFMDDFSVVGSSFDDCLDNFDKVLARCEETNLVLNWEKCHFLVKEGIVLGHKISNNGIEDEKAKNEVICKLPPPTSLTTTPIITAPNWIVLFELMCDASDIALGAILGQCINKIFNSVYYASKTMNSSQVKYTIMEKDLLAIVFAIEKFRPYLMGAKVIVHTYHAALHYITSKKDSKARLMRWVLLLQEFDIDIHDRKGNENQLADHFLVWRRRGGCMTALKSMTPSPMSNFGYFNERGVMARGSSKFPCKWYHP
ncbi:uncharacterized protein [Nicotiana sylvestris]|uniref:uncharacterized protein n=1 Tax=Nicotiana sylvestris TaxID=4096 RepID=UPI00388C9D0A